MTNETFKFYGILPNSLLWSARVNGSHLSTTFYDSLVALFNNSASFQTTAVLFHLIWLWSKCFCPLASGPRAICPRSCIFHPSCLHDFYPGFHTYYLPCLVHEIKWGKICGKRKENKPTPLTKLRARRRRPLCISFTSRCRALGSLWRSWLWLAMWRSEGRGQWWRWYAHWTGCLDVIIMISHGRTVRRVMLILKRYSHISREGVRIISTLHLDLLSSSRCTVRLWSGPEPWPWRGRAWRDTYIGRCEDDTEYFPGNHCWRARVLLSAEIGRWIEAFLEFNRHGRHTVGGGLADERMYTFWLRVPFYLGNYVIVLFSFFIPSLSNVFLHSGKVFSKSPIEIWAVCIGPKSDFGGFSCEIVLYVCKRGRRENPKYVIMTFRQKARVRENPKKRDRTIGMYGAKVLSMYQVHM